MIDYEILKEAGTTNERLRELLTNQDPSSDDGKMRMKIEDLIGSRVTEHITFALKNHHLYSSVDLAWDSSPINKSTIPLILYAQKRIDINSCLEDLDKNKSIKKYVKRDDTGKVTDIDLPKFFEVNVNMVRSFVTRRLAAQVNKYNNLYPFFKYDSRTTGQVGKLRADALSQRMDIMADQYDYRHFQTQAMRDMFLYGHSVAFPRASWEREIHWEKDPVAEEFKVGGRWTGKIPKRSKVTKEGVGWVLPHPSRVFWDNAYPLTSINTDSGAEYIGFWDVKRYGDIADNPDFFNRDEVGYGAGSSNTFAAFSNYFSQYYTKVSPPTTFNDLSGHNERLTNTGKYSGQMRDASVFVGEYYAKLVPKDYNIGTYPHPIWVHFKLAGDSTVIFAEIMPSTPAAVFSFNENDSRLANLSIAHEMMPYQDQLTNLFSQMLETTKADLFSVAVVNSDIFPDTDEGRKVLDDFRKTMSGENFYATTNVLEASFQKLRDIGIDTKADNIFKVVRSSPSTSITTVFQAINNLIGMAERLMALSPQEQGQPAPRETSATEVAIINQTTESVYNFISESIDEGRGAMKRICYESLISLGSKEVYLPVVNRYTTDIIERAGFRFVPDEDEAMNSIGSRRTIVGTVSNLMHDYVFSSRDGAERTINSQSAQTLVQLLGILMQPAFLPSIEKAKLYEIINEVFRLSGATDLKLTVSPGEEGASASTDPETQKMLSTLAQAIQENSAAIEQLGGAAQPPQPQPQPQPTIQV
tara:strand:+ start:6107 stop:8371 length:2265 start_codon:yes stop_codon:yes gene_type:complete